eukprot:6474348-Amphidinium_carterae.1
MGRENWHPMGNAAPSTGLQRQRPMPVCHSTRAAQPSNFTPSNALLFMAVSKVFSDALSSMRPGSAPGHTAILPEDLASLESMRETVQLGTTQENPTLATELDQGFPRVRAGKVEVTT